MRLVPSARLMLSLLALVALTAAVIAAADTSQYRNPDNYTFYPCTTCHASMKVTGLKNRQPFHHIDLTKGSHAGLYCVNCHSTPDVWNMKTVDGKEEIAIPGLMGHKELLRMNKVCERCHPQTYMDYVHLAHANKTYVCQGGEDILVQGYKGVGYHFHVCKEYKNLKTIASKACVECHDPHVGVYHAINLLPPHDERPAPPPQSSIAYGTLAVAIAGVALILGSVVLASYVREH